MTVLAAMMALSTLQRPPVFVPSVRIVSLGGPSRMVQQAKSPARTETAAKPVVEPQPVPRKPEPPKPKEKEKKSRTPPEKLPPKPVTKDGTAPKTPEGSISKGPAPKPKAAPATGNEPATKLAAAAAPASGI